MDYINIFYPTVKSSFCCAFLCKNCNPRTNGSKVISRQILCNFFWTTLYIETAVEVQK